jgi:hypothetical protein
MEARGPYCPVDLVNLVTMLKDAALPWREWMWVFHATSGWGSGGVARSRDQRQASLSQRPAQPSRLGKSLLPAAIINVRMNFLNSFIFERLQRSVRPNWKTSLVSGWIDTGLRSQKETGNDGPRSPSLQVLSHDPQVPFRFLRCLYFL